MAIAPGIESAMSAPPYIRTNTLRRALREAIRARRLDYLYHCLYGIAAKLRYRLIGPRAAVDNDAQNRALAHMRAHGFAVVEDSWGKQAAYGKFAQIFEEFHAFCASHSLGYRPLQYIRMAGYSGIQAELTNQLHADSVSDSALALARAALEESGIGGVVREFLGCHYGICNVRIWRFFPITKPSDSRIAPHSDNFPANMIKLMVFPGDLTSSNGGSELYATAEHNQPYFNLEGANPMMLFDPTNVIHGAPAPVTGYRDAIELTLMPQVRRTPQVISAGFQAGYPVVPWSSWRRKCHWIVGR